MGTKKIIGGITSIGTAATYLSQTIPQYLLQKAPDPNNLVEFGMWLATNIVTLGSAGYGAYKLLTRGGGD